MSDIGEFGGSGGGGTPGTPLHSIQFNNPLGTFAGSADLTWVGGSGMVDLQHAAVGNFGAINNVLYAPGDPTFATPTAINVPLSVNEYFSGDLPTLGAYIDGQAIFTGYKHIGLGNAFVYGLDIENWINTDSTGPFGQFYGAWVATTNLGTGTVSEHVGVLSACTDLALTQIVSFHSDFLSQGVVHSTAGTVASYYAQKRIGNAMGVGGVATDFAAFVADLQFDMLASTTNYYGAKIGVPSGTPTISGTAYGIYVGDHNGLGGAPLSANLRSVGSGSLNIFEGTIDIGLAGSNTGKLDFIGTTSGKVTLSTQDAAGTWTLKLPTTAGTANWFLQTDGVGNTTWAAGGGGGGSPSLPANSVQYYNGGSFGGATHFNISSGQPMVTIGNAYLYERVFGAPQNMLFQIDNTGGFGDPDVFIGGAGNFTLTSSGAGGNFCEGPNAGRNLTTGFWNMVEGASALASCTTGLGNLAFGRHAMNANIDGSNNVALGSGAMNLATGGNFNMAIGVGALGSGVLITGGNSNVAIGNSAGQNLAGGSASNIFIGANAGQAATATGNQTIIGNGAAVNLTTAPGANEIIGDSCAPNFTAGYFNVIIGSSGGGGATTCSYSTIIGRLAGPTYSTGSNSIIIGYACDVPSSSASGQISIGNMIYGTGCTGTGATPSSGQIGIGVPSPTAILHVAPGTTSNAQIRLPSGSTPSSPNDGDLWYDGTHLDFRHAGVTTDLLAGGGGSPGAPLNSVQYDNGGVFGGAAHFNIDASGRPNVDTGYAYMYAGTKEALYGVPNVAGDNFFEGEAGNHTVTGEANFGTGTNALSSLTTGQRNVAVGVAACQFLTTGSQNVAFGFGAMANCISESGSVAIGGAALSGGSSGGTNVAIGASALLGNTTGSGNFAMGFHALLSNTTGSGSIGIGTGVLVSNTTGRNLAIGALAIQSCTGSGNCSIGFQSGQSVTTANNNVAVGDNALFGPGCGDLNTAIGTACLGGNAGIFTGDHCTVVGSQAGGNMSSGVANGLFGWLSGFNISSGSNNILLGYSTGNSITTGSHNLVLGDSVDTGSNVSGCIVIGQNATNRLDYNLTNSGKWTAKAAMVLPVSAVASLPAGVAGAMAFVNDATQTMTAGVGAVVAGGGANTVPVYHDGTNWRIG